METVRMRRIFGSYPDKTVWLCLSFDKEAANVMVTVHGTFHATVSIYQLQVSLKGVIEEFDMNIVQRVGCHRAKIMKPDDLDIALYGSCEAKTRDA
jgi:hypothetical protein